MYRQSPSAPRRRISLAEPPRCTCLPSGPVPSIDQSRTIWAVSAGNEHMARLCLQRQAEFEIALEFGGDLGVIRNGPPVFRDEHGLRGIYAHHRADLAGVKSLNQRRDHAFGFSRE